MKREVYLDESENCDDFLSVATGHLLCGFQINAEQENASEIVIINREDGQKLLQQLKDWLE